MPYSLPSWALAARRRRQRARWRETFSNLGRNSTSIADPTSRVAFNPEVDYAGGKSLLFFLAGNLKKRREQVSEEREKREKRDK